MHVLTARKGVDLHFIRSENEDPSYLYFNPSVLRLQDRWLVSLRQVNLERSDVTGKFFLRPPHEEIRSEIVLCELDSDFQTVRATRVDLNVDGAQAVRDAGGFEDPRLVLSPDGRVECMACMPGPGRVIKHSANREMGFESRFQMQMGRIAFGDDRSIERVTAYQSPFGRKIEKNWSPFFSQGRLHLVYQWNPLVVIEPQSDGALRFVRWFDRSSLLSDLRGGSAGIPTKNGFLFVTHRNMRVEGKLRYSHQLVELDHELRPIRMSEDFVFLSLRQLEYCSGLSRSDGRYVMSFGVNDALSFLTVLTEDHVESMLRPLETEIEARPALLEASREEQLREVVPDFRTDWGRKDAR